MTDNEQEVAAAHSSELATDVVSDLIDTVDLVIGLMSDQDVEDRLSLLLDIAGAGSQDNSKDANATSGDRTGLWVSRAQVAVAEAHVASAFQVAEAQTQRALDATRAIEAAEARAATIRASAEAYVDDALDRANTYVQRAVQVAVAEGASPETAIVNPQIAASAVQLIHYFESGRNTRLQVRALADKGDTGALRVLARERALMGDYAEAERLYRIAADCGNADAIYDLRWLRAHVGIERDSVEQSRDTECADSDVNWDDSGGSSYAVDRRRQQARHYSGRNSGSNASQFNREGRAGRFQSQL